MLKSLLSVLALCLVLFSFAQSSSIVPGQAIVQISAGSDIDDIVKDLESVNGVNTSLIAKDLLSDHMRAWLLAFDPDQITEEQMVKQLRIHPSIQIAQFNHTVKLRETTPDDVNFGDQWHHVQNNDSDIDSDLAWDITTGGTTAYGDEIVVCVIEGGNLLHPDLEANRWINLNEIPDNGIDDDNNGFIDDYDGWNVNSEDDSGVFQGGHGTNVAGMIGAVGDNGIGVAGINWDVKIMSVAGESIFDEASVIEAYNYPLVQRKLYNQSGGTQGAFVVATNASWGIDNGDPADIPIWCNFYDTLGTYGVLNCGATANNNVNIDVVGDIPTACSSPYMISVTATNNNDVRTFSAYGATTVDLGSPGESVWTTSGSNGYTSTSGTSFASPLTAGAIALLYSVPCPSLMAVVQSSPQTGADLIMNALYEGVDPVPNLQGETVTGGRLNVYNSLNILISNCSSNECLVPFGVNASTEDGVIYNLSWGAIESMIGFNLRYRVVGVEEWVEVNELETNSYTLEELVWCTDYEFQLSSICSEEESDWSGSYFITTDGCCESPLASAIELSDLGENSVSVSWPSILAAENYELMLFDGDGNETIYSMLEETSLVLNDLNACMTYSIMVQSNCIEEENSGYSDEVSFTTFGCGSCVDNTYCPSIGNTEDEFIDRVAIGTIDNTSGSNDGYGDYTTLSTEIQHNTDYSIDLAPGFEGTIYEEYFIVWIDMNQDGTFTEDEIVFESEEESADPQSGTIQLADNVPTGNTRMRVSMAWGGGFFFTPQGSCDELAFGEVEDYCIEVAEQVVGVGENEALAKAVYPNPSNGIFSFSMKKFGNYSVEIFDLNGRLSASESFRTTEYRLDLNSLSEGFYTYRLLEDGNPAGNGKLIIQK